MGSARVGITPGERLFQRYLEEHKIQHVYHPALSGASKHPDFTLGAGTRLVLCEVTDFGVGEQDKPILAGLRASLEEHESGIATATWFGALSFPDILQRIQSKVIAEVRQLDEFRGRHPLVVVLFNAASISTKLDDHRAPSSQEEEDMRNLVMWNLVTLDGFFEGQKSWDIDWHGSVWGEELERLSIDQLKSSDLLLFGRVTYQGMAAYWPSATGEVADLMNTIPKVVFSRTLESAEWSGTRLVRQDAEDEVARLKRQPGKDMFIFGSANLCSTLTQRDLIDEYRLCIAPVILGHGSPLFKPNPHKITMKLLEARPLASGGVIHRYRPNRPQ